MKQATNRDRKLIRLLTQIEAKGHHIGDLMLNPDFHDWIGQYHAKQISKADLFAKLNQLQEKK